MISSHVLKGFPGLWAAIETKATTMIKMLSGEEQHPLARCLFDRRQNMN